MVVALSNQSLEEIFVAKPSKPCPPLSRVPAIDLAGPTAAAEIVAACSEFGFFKVTNHGVPGGLAARLEAAAAEFFALPEPQKERAGGGPAADPLGYGSRKIGSNGDVGWLEYLLLEVTKKPIASIPYLDESWVSSFWCAVKEYVSAMRRLAGEVLELMAEGLGLEERSVLSRLVSDERSDSFFRLNHYPTCPFSTNQFLNGFGEHTDPQIVSLLRSNDSDGLQIALKDGTWVLIPPDQNSFFINVGDSLQVLTNGRFKSVRHRVVTNGRRSRLSMIYFGGPPLSARIEPLPQLLLRDGGHSRYTAFTWGEFKAAAFKSRLADNRLGCFEKPH